MRVIISAIFVLISVITTSLARPGHEYNHGFGHYGYGHGFRHPYPLGGFPYGGHYGGHYGGYYGGYYGSPFHYGRYGFPFYGVGLKG